MAAKAAVLIRHSAGAVFAVIAVLLLPPEATKGEQYPWVGELHEAQPLEAWGYLRHAPFRYIEGGDPFGMPSLADSWLTLAAWPLVAVALAMVVVQRRDL